MGRLKALDLMCGAGGITRGLQIAGFRVVGVDINEQPNYCGDEFHQADALDFDLSGYDLITASPPCQAYSVGTKRWSPEQYPDLIAPIRERLESSGRPYVIENVPGSPLRAPVRLCGEQFGLRVVRHRHFESNVQLYVPKHKRHRDPIQRPALDGTDRLVWRSWYMTVAGHGGQSNSYKLEDWKAAMGIDWMSRSELIEAIPPAYAEYLGRQIARSLAHP